IVAPYGKGAHSGGRRLTSVRIRQPGDIRLVRIPPASVAFTLLMSFLVAVPSFGIDMSLPALTATGAALRVAPAQAGLMMSLFMLDGHMRRQDRSEELEARTAYGAEVRGTEPCVPAFRLLVIQIDGIQVMEDLRLLGVVGIDGKTVRHHERRSRQTPSSPMVRVALIRS